MSHDSRVGTEIAGYSIESVIARGGMSIVYLATQEFPKRRVALKFLAPELAEQAGFRERFIRESNAAASLDHPNVIPIYGAGEHDGQLWIAMRFVEGTDLSHLLGDEGALPPERTVRIVEQVASALDAAHDIGLVHRDVKPGNILLARSDHAYLTDFGIIKRREAGTEFTKTGDFLGTVDYAAPEQIRGERVDARADVYSLGCLTYECLTGEPPYPRETELAVLYAHLEEATPPRPSMVRLDLPRAVDEATTRAMAKDAAQRYGTAGELAAGLRKALSGAPTTETTTAPPRSHRRRTRVVMAGTAVVLAALIAVIAVIAVTVWGGSPVAAPSDAGSGSVAATASGSAPSATASGGEAKPLLGKPIRVHTVAALDAATGRVLEDFDVGRDPDSIAFSEGHVWVVNNGDQTLSMIDSTTGEVLTQGGVQSPCLVSPAEDGGVWVSSCAGDKLSHVDPDFEVGPVFDVEAPGQAAEYQGSLWVVSERSVNGAFGTKDVVERRDPTDGTVLKTISVGEGAADLTVFDGAIWGCNFYDNAVWRIDPRTNHAEILASGQFDRPLRLAAGPAGLWVNDSPSMTQLTQDLERVAGVVDVYGTPVVSGLNVWAVDGTGAFVNRSQISMVTSRRIIRIDFATHDVEAFQSPYATDAVAGDGKIWISAGPVESPGSHEQGRGSSGASG